MPLSPAELEVRRPVWSAMSDLFLDTETRWSVPFVGRVCAASGLDDEVLERVFWCEVFPLAIENLHSIAGDWAMLSLSEPQLIDRAENPRHDRVNELTSAWMVSGSWKASMSVCRRLRSEPAGRHLVLAGCWTGFGHHYLEHEKDLGKVKPRPELGQARAAGVDLAAEWTFYRPVLLGLLMDDERPSVAARDAEVTNAIAAV